MTKLARLFKKFRRPLSDRGASMPMIAAALIPMIGAIGGAVDLANVYMVRSQLRDAVDSAALTGGRLYYASDRDVQVNNYLVSNLPALLVGNTLKNVAITPAAAGSGMALTVSAEVEVKTFLIRLLGINSMLTKASATVERRSNALELVLALDNTRSMSRTDGGPTARIEALKSATKNFLGVVYGGATDNPNLSISILPYTSYVNIGKLLIDEQAATGKTYLQTIPGYNYDPATGLGWKGCVDEPDTDNTIDDTTDIEDDTKWMTAYDTREFLPGVSGAPLFKPSLTPAFGRQDTVTMSGGTSCYGAGSYWQDGEEISYSGSAPGCVSSPPTPLATPYVSTTGHLYEPPAGYSTSPNWLRKDSNWTASPDGSWGAAATYPSNDGSPNVYCPSATLPLKPHNKTVLENYVDNEMRAYDMGSWVEGTMSNSALAWAYRLLTPALPFAAPAKTTSRDKVIVLMTDGILSQSRDWNTRSGFGYIDDKRLINSNGSTTADRDASTKALAARMSRMCVLAKRAGIVVYTVTFKVAASDPLADLYRDCASSPSKFFSADDPAALSTAFTEIASDLSSIRIVK